MRTRAILPSLLLPLLLSAQQTEIEPNENTSQATDWTYGLTMSGGECNPPTFDTDYFRIVLPSDGVITFTVTSQGSGLNPGDLQFSLFPKQGFYSQQHALPGSSAPTTQTFSHNCLSGDTMYVRVQEMNVGNNSCVSYVMSFSVAPAVFANDIVNNDDPQNPQMVALGQSFEGHLDHLYDGSQDWYGLTLPVDGTLRIIAEAEHADATTTGVLSIYVDVNNSSYTLPIGASHVATIDTFIVRCFAAQPVKIRVANANTSTCGISYRLRIEQIPQVFANDAGPNNDPQAPQPIALDTPVEGHLNFFGDGSQDWYGLTLPDDGMLRVIGEAEQHDTISNGLVNVYLDQLNSSIQVPVGASSTAGVDTFLFHCVRPGPVKVGVQPANANGCGISYRLRFELLSPAYANDAEPNEDQSEAIVVPAGVMQEGHLSYIGTSSYDHYKLWKPLPGTMAVIFSSSMDAPSPALSVWTLNANVNENITSGGNGEVAQDTIHITTAGPDTIQLRVSSTACGSYRFHYDGTAVGIADRTGVLPLITVMPNPSNDGVFQLQQRGAAVRTITVFDANGRAVSVVNGPFTGDRIQLDLAHLAAGTYTLSLLGPDGDTGHVRAVILR